MTQEDSESHDLFLKKLSTRRENEKKPYRERTPFLDKHPLTEKPQEQSLILLDSLNKE